MVLAQTQIYVDQWNRAENPVLDSHQCGQLIFNKAGKSAQWKKGQYLSQIMLGKLDSDMQKIEPAPLSYTYTKINSKWTKDLTVRQKTIKILEEKAGSNLFDLSHSNFLTSHIS